MTVEVSPARRREVMDALRRGAVPMAGLDLLAVGLARFERAVDEDLAAVAAGGAVFKMSLRGVPGLQAREESRFRPGASCSSPLLPLHSVSGFAARLEGTRHRATVGASDPPSLPVRQGVERGMCCHAPLRHLRGGAGRGNLPRPPVGALTCKLGPFRAEKLTAVRGSAPTFATALRGYRAATAAGDQATAAAVLAWLGGQPNVAASARRAVGVRGDLDHFGAFSFLQGLLAVLRDCGHTGLLLVLDEVETLQRVRSDARDKALNALRQLIDDVHAGRFPGLYLVITGTPAFYDGQQGVQRLSPLAQRLATDFSTDARFDNPRAVQVRLPGFNLDALGELGGRVRDLYADGSAVPERITALADDAYVGDLARAVTGDLGGKVGVVPRLFLKKLVGDVLDRVDLFPDFDPRKHYAPTLSAGEMTEVERNAARATSADEVPLDLP